MRIFSAGTFLNLGRMMENDGGEGRSVGRVGNWEEIEKGAGEGAVRSL